jgi:hypothetical protein
VAEWLKAAVSKTVMGHWPIESSNLSLSATTSFGTFIERSWVLTARDRPSHGAGLVSGQEPTHELASTYRWTTHPWLATCHQRFFVGSAGEVVSGK